MEVERRLNEHYGKLLPEAPLPVAAYVPVVQVGKLLYLSGQGPYWNGEQKYTGRVGESVTAQEGYQAAQLCGLNLISQAKKYLGDLDCVKRIVNVKIYVASSPDFYDHPKVANGVSDLLMEAFGEKGKHSRCALGMYVLPSNIPVEAEMVLEIE